MRLMARIENTEKSKDWPVAYSVARLRALVTCALGLPLLLLLSACASSPLISAHKVASLPPLQLENRTIEPAEVSTLTTTPDLLAVSEEMRTFVETYTGDTRHPRQRLRMLHSAITGPATLGVEYKPFASGSAQDVFRSGQANCLSYASLFVALAREAGLNAQYQWLEVKPQWTRQGERVMVRLHVNVAVQLRGREQFMVDIDPLQSRDIAASKLISDRDAQALYHSNIAMEALAREALEEAWVNAVRALQLSPRVAHLWVNIGAIYRLAGQHDAAQASYLQALEIDPWDRSAMNNLAVLHHIEGNAEQLAYWEGRVARYREANPYYHAWLGDKAGEEKNWPEAARFYEKALAIRPEDSGLLFALGVIHTHLGQPTVATDYIQRAIDHATLFSDIKAYEQKLDALHRAVIQSDT
ncbi:MAG: tetratricopeptide repeat protein [Halioglobus sp.]